MGFAGKVAVVVLDGFGLDPQVEWSIVTSIWHRLNAGQRKAVLGNAGGDEELALASLAPTSHGVARVLSRKHGRDFKAEFARIRKAHEELEDLAGESRLEEVFTSQRQTAAREATYAPWVANTPFIYDLRQENATWITRAAGVFAGHADLRPEIMGNSDTGHQQLFNLAVARQIPAFLTDMITSGEFFELAALNADLMRANDGATVVFKTLLSGEHGDDGFVHSAWPHLEAFLKLYFEVLKLPAARLQIEAVLDGRDSPGRSSMRYEERDGVFRFGFLRKLKKLLMKYEAQNSLRWIIGRQFMDRDYKGGMIRKEYEMLTGERADSPTASMRLFSWWSRTMRRATRTLRLSQSSSATRCRWARIPSSSTGSFGPIVRSPSLLPCWGCGISSVSRQSRSSDSTPGTVSPGSRLLNSSSCGR